jgi:TPR repeat protein
MRLAAEAGQVDAQMTLGMRLLSGDGVDKNATEALSWFQRAANQGFGRAQSQLGLLYAQGIGVPKDLVVAHAWLSLAVDSGVKPARRNRDTLATGLSAAQRERSNRLQAEYRAKIAPEPERPR